MAGTQNGGLGVFHSVHPQEVTVFSYTFSIHGTFLMNPLGLVSRIYPQPLRARRWDPTHLSLPSRWLNDLIEKLTGLFPL